MKNIKFELKMDLSQSELLSQELERRHLKMMPKNAMKFLLKLITTE